MVDQRKVGVAGSPVDRHVGDLLAVVFEVELSQVGINALANTTGHLAVAINFSWLLITGFLVLFMQVGFAMVETGFCRAKNAAHTTACRGVRTRVETTVAMELAAS